MCPQPLYQLKKLWVIGKEDCLYLNVYTPKVKPFEVLMIY